MTERKSRPQPSVAPAEATSSTWNLAGVGESLKSQPQSLTDRLAGPGQAFHLADGVTLTVFPERQLLRFTSPLAELTIAPVTNIEPQADRLRVESSDVHHKATVLFDPKGGLIFTLQPNEARSTTKPTVVEASMEPAADEAEPAPAPAGLAAETTADTSDATASPPASTEDERGERLVFTGRVGRVPELKTTAKGRRLVRIPLAVHEGEETRWHTIVFFDDLAERAVATLAKGELVSVVGYRHVREIETKRGTKQQELIFAAALQGARIGPKS